MALTKQDIAKAGLRLLNEVGLEGLTVRAIAEELGVKAPALYWHLKNKQELIDEVATQMYLAHIRPLPPARQHDDWAERLAERARAIRRTMLTYRDGAKLFSGTFFTDEALPEEAALEEIAAAGYTPEQALCVLSTVFHFVIGFTIEQQSIEPMPGERDARYEEAAKRLRARGGVIAGAVDATMFGDFDEKFEHGLHLVLLGASTKKFRRGTGAAAAVTPAHAPKGKKLPTRR